MSEGAYATLNTSAGAGDDPDVVRQNVALIERALDVSPERLFYGSQVHGVDVAIVRTGDTRDDVLVRKVDAVATSLEGTGCGVRSADCGTVLVGDRRSGAVAAIHAGWRGTVLGVVAAGVRALRASLDQEPDLVAAVGPHIERCCFEVGDDVAAELAACSTAGERAVDRSRSKPHVDLRIVLETQLRDLGFDAAAIDHVRGCTVCDADRFFSYRRDGARSGRLMAAIVTSVRSR